MSVHPLATQDRGNSGGGWHGGRSLLAVSSPNLSNMQGVRHLRDQRPADCSSAGIINDLNLVPPASRASSQVAGNNTTTSSSNRSLAFKSCHFWFDA